MVLIAVAKFELIFLRPIFISIAVRDANIDDRRAKKIDIINPYFLMPNYIFFILNKNKKNLFFVKIIIVFVKLQKVYNIFISMQ